MKHRAFTLAETLITLGIIGVVAVLVLPPHIHKHRMKVLEAQFKKAYSLIQNVNQMMIKDDINPYQEFVAYRELDKNNFNSVPERLAIQHMQTLAKYIPNSNLCSGTYATCNGYTRHQGVYKILKGDNGAHIDPDAYTKITLILPDGSLIWRGGLTYGPNRYYYDINGIKKGPNRLGYDLFTFIINQNGTITGERDRGSNYSINRCSFVEAAHSANYLGFGCGYYAMNNINPDGTGTYWGDFLK